MTTLNNDSAVLAVPGAHFAVRRRADGRVLAAALVVGLLLDLAVRSGVSGLAGALTVAAAASGLVVTGRAATSQGKALAGAAILFGAFLAVRTTEWLILPNIAAAALLLALAATTTDGRSVFDLTFPTALTRLATATLHTAAAPAFLATAKRDRKLPPAAVRGAALAAPIVVVLAALLASADAVFASLFRFPSSAEQLVLHTLLIAVGTWGMAGLLRTASAEPPTPPPATKRLHHTEANVVLGCLVALFAAFAVTQVVTAAGGARHVLERQGLTYAEYARSGFFQLLAVAAITMATLLAIRALAQPTRQTTLLAEAAVALTLVIVGVALYRLDLYERAFGLTMLRLYSQAAAAWIAIVFVLLGAALAGVAAHRHWLPGAAATTALALLLLLNIANPEAVVVKRNVARATPPTDTAYLATLGDDAVPALANAGIPLSPRQCETPHHKGWAAANWSRSRANGVRNGAGVCHP